MATVLVVGGAGYVGSVLAGELLDRGYAVRILDRMYFGDRGLTDIRDRVEVDETCDIDPPGAYAGSKLAAERELLPMASDDLCVAVVRKATLYGFSPRMRYDLVVNTFVKDALHRGRISLHYGGEMWRPLTDVRDAARSYIALLRADTTRINGMVFNVVYRNFRISELALRVRQALEALDIPVAIETDYNYRGIRNYRVSGRKLLEQVKFEPSLAV